MYQGAGHSVIEGLRRHDTALARSLYLRVLDRNRNCFGKGRKVDSTRFELDRWFLTYEQWEASRTHLHPDAD